MKKCDWNFKNAGSNEKREGSNFWRPMRPTDDMFFESQVASVSGLEEKDS